MATGSLTLYTRKEINDLIESLGGKAAGSVSERPAMSSQANAGSKPQAMAELGIPVLTEEEFRTMIESVLSNEIHRRAVSTKPFTAAQIL